MDLHFKHLHTLQERCTVYSLYTQLNPTLTQSIFESRMEDLMQTNYQLLALFDANILVAIAGYWINTKLYCGAYLEPDNVVVDKNYRSKGVGAMLQKELEKIAIQNSCEVMMLDAYLQNTRGHDFYTTHGYEKKGYHFVKKL